MKAKTWRFHIAIISLIIFSLMLTSCLADMLNKRFGYELPIYLSYHSDYGKAPSRKRIEPGYTLTEDDLAGIGVSDNEFLGWYFDQECTSPATAGTILYDSTTLYARWRYNNNGSYNTTYLIRALIFDPSVNSSTEFVLDSYWKVFESQYEAEIFNPFEGTSYEYIANHDNIHYEENFYWGPDASTYFDSVYVVDKYFYEKYTTFDNLKYYQKFQFYSDLTLNLYLTTYKDAGTDLASLSLPLTNLHLEECTECTSLLYQVFISCTWLREIYLPSFLSTIDESTFYGCSNLVKVEMPLKMDNKINNYAFANCTSLEEIKIPKYSGSYTSLSLGNGIFMECTNLKTVYIPADVLSIPAGMFKDCDNITTVYYEGSSKPSTSFFGNGNGSLSSANWICGASW